jgi:hypothetical protein
MTKAETALVVVMRIGAVTTMLALGAVFMPFSWMDWIHERIGLGKLPDLPITGYLTRSFSAFYAYHGAMLWLIASDVRRFDPLVRFLGFACLAFGSVTLVIDALVGMPLLWTVCEGPVIVVLGIAILWLRRAAAAAPNPAP